MTYFENTRIKLGNMTFETNWWNVINCERHVKCVGSMIVNHLLTSCLIMLASFARKRMWQFIANGGFNTIKVVKVGA